MKTIGAARFKEQCLALLAELDEDGIVVTKRGRPIARVLPIHEREDNDDLIGSLKGSLHILGDVEVPVAWVPGGWGNLNAVAQTRRGGNVP